MSKSPNTCWMGFTGYPGLQKHCRSVDTQKYHQDPFTTAVSGDREHRFAKLAMSHSDYRKTAHLCVTCSSELLLQRGCVCLGGAPDHQMYLTQYLGCAGTLKS